MLVGIEGSDSEPHGAPHIHCSEIFVHERSTLQTGAGDHVVIHVQPRSYFIRFHAVDRDAHHSQMALVGAGAPGADAAEGLDS